MTIVAALVVGIFVGGFLMGLLLALLQISGKESRREEAFFPQDVGAMPKPFWTRP